MKLDWTRERLAGGLQCFRDGQFFRAHEYWEGVWLEAQEPQRSFLQALIQVAAAFHHFQRGNEKGTRVLLSAALGRLEPYASCSEGVCVARLCNDIRVWLGALTAQDGSSVPTAYPSLRFCSSAKRPDYVQ